MSYILEALRKSERERQAGQAPSLPSLLSDPPRPSRSWLAWLVLGLLLFNAFGLIYVWLNGWGKSPISAQPTGPAPEPSTAENPTARLEPHSSAASRDAAPSADIIENPPPAAGPGTSAAAKSSPGRSDRPPETKSGGTASRPLARPTPVVSSKPKAAPAPRAELDADTLPENEEVGYPRPEPVVGESAERLAAVRAPEPMLPAPHPVADAEPFKPAARSDIPWLRDLPAEFRDRVPPFKINIYAYSKSPTDRFAIIDMSKYLPGDRVPGGALLLEIRADGLVLDLDGTKFRVPRP